MLFTVLAIYSCAIGLLNLLKGAAKESRGFAVANVVVRATGAGLLVCGIALFFGQRWSAAGLAALYAIALVEVAATVPSARTHPQVLVIAVVSLGTPLAILGATLFA